MFAEAAVASLSLVQRRHSFPSSLTAPIAPCRSSSSWHSVTSFDGLQAVKAPGLVCNWLTPHVYCVESKLMSPPIFILFLPLDGPSQLIFPLEKFASDQCEELLVLSCRQCMDGGKPMHSVFLSYTLVKTSINTCNKRSSHTAGRNIFLCHFVQKQLPAHIEALITE